jgi:hypothetical protein
MRMKELIPVVEAAATVLIFVAAIWGDRIKDRLFGPRLALSLLDPAGDLTERMNGITTRYYHIRVTNRPQSVARSAQVLVSRVSRRDASGGFQMERVVYALPLIWTPAELAQFERKVVSVSTCDFGFIDQNAPAFRLATAILPNNFRGTVAKGEAARFEMKAEGENVFHSTNLVLEVSWDGEWHSDGGEMRKHLVIKEVDSLV